MASRSHSICRIDLTITKPSRRTLPSIHPSNSLPTPHFFIFSKISTSVINAGARCWHAGYASELAQPDSKKSSPHRLSTLRLPRRPCSLPNRARDLSRLSRRKCLVIFLFFTPWIANELGVVYKLEAKQASTAASNIFELAIAAVVTKFGENIHQTFAATFGTL